MLPGEDLEGEWEKPQGRVLRERVPMGEGRRVGATSLLGPDVRQPATCCGGIRGSRLSERVFFHCKAHKNAVRGQVAEQSAGTDGVCRRHGAGTGRARRWGSPGRLGRRARASAVPPSPQVCTDEE